MKRFVVPTIIILAAVAVAVTLFLLRPKIDLIVVNTSGAAVQVTANGQDLRLDAGEQRRLEVAAGLTLRARAADGGAAIAEINTSCAGARTWVFSVAPVTTWWEASRGYGDLAHVGTSCAAFLAPGPLFPLPADFLPQVDEPLPEQVRAKKGTTGVVRKALWTSRYVERVHPRRGWVAVHVGAGLDKVRLERDGQLVNDLVSGEVAHLEVASGPIALRATVLEGPAKGKTFEAQGVIEAAAVPLAPAPGHVWDIEGSTRFLVVTRRYGPPPAPGEPEPTVPAPREFDVPSGLYRLPDGFHFRVDGPLPESWSHPAVVEFLVCDTVLRRLTQKPRIPKAVLDEVNRPGPGQPKGQALPPEPDSPFPPVGPR